MNKDLLNILKVKKFDYYISVKNKFTGRYRIIILNTDLENLNQLVNQYLKKDEVIDIVKDDSNFEISSADRPGNGFENPRRGTPSRCWRRCARSLRSTSHGWRPEVTWIAPE